MIFSKLDRVISYLLLLFSGIVLIYVALYSTVHYEGSESINHYLFSAAIYSHPEVVLDNWGKPLFMILSAPFTVFGEKGVMIFNCLVMLLSAFFAFKFLKELEVRWAFPVVLLIIFAPVYYNFAQSCLTEPLFGLVAISSAYLFLKRKYLLATLIISFIVFARTEGMLFIPLFAFALIVRRKYSYLPFLLSGFFVYSISGWIMGKGILIFFTSYPYSAVVDFYGTGPFWHWFTNHEHITGVPFSILLVISTGIIVFNSLRNFNQLLSQKKLVFIFLVFGPAIIYIFGHSYLWYKGLSASIGLYRIVGGVIPMLAVIAIVGIDYLIKGIESIPNGRYISLSIMGVISIWIVSFTYNKKDSLIFVQPSELEKTVARSIDWIKENELHESTMIVYQAQYLITFKSKKFDPDNSKIKEGNYAIRNRSKPHESMNKGDLFIWDGKGTPLEGGIPIENMDTTYFDFLAEFRPENEFDVHMAGKYYIKIFRRK